MWQILRIKNEYRAIHHKISFQQCEYIWLLKQLKCFFFYNLQCACLLLVHVIRMTMNRLFTTHDAECYTEQSHVTEVERRLKETVHSSHVPHTHTMHSRFNETRNPSEQPYFINHISWVFHKSWQHTTAFT